VPERIVIVGTGLAGATAAVTLRREGFDRSITLVGDEDHLPYERPPLSKSYLRGETRFDAALVRPASFYRDNAIELRTATRVARIDTDRRVVVAGDDELPYDALLIATGSRNRSSRFAGAGLPGVYALRTVEEADAIRTVAAGGAHVAVCGMGFIGTEVTASMRILGAEVTGIVRQATPLQNVLGEEVGRSVARIHRDHGVRLITGDGVSRLEGTDRIEAVVTDSGVRVPCDAAVLAFGVEPETDLASGTAIEVDDGIVVDERCRSSVEDVFACGDVARFPHPILGRSMRIEHWHHARAHAKAAARSILGRDDPYDEIPWFWSEQYDHEIQYAGQHDLGDELIIDRDEGSDAFGGLFVRDGVIRAALALDRARAVRESIRRIGHPLVPAAEPAGG
jgi:3-phenylpropionate/trans-cinnamate dioxygenase ferredoxin reductase subunit